MRRVVPWVICLVALDQAVKLIIANFFIDTEFTIVQNFLYFYVTQNIYLGWIPSMLGVAMPLYVAVFLVIISWLFIVIAHRYLIFITYDFTKYKTIPHLFLALLLSASICKLIDDIFWGGSLDFILLFDWFIFDLKDVYITIGVSLTMFYAITYEVLQYKNFSKEERKENTKKHSFLRWLKNGLPTAPSTPEILH